MDEIARKNPKILLVGAGAVGQAYGYHLRRGGAEVSYLVKPKYRAQVEAGFLLYRHQLIGEPRALHFGDFEVLTDHDAVGAEHWDQVWLCVSSTALKGEWLEDLCARIGDATLVSLQPGLEDIERVSAAYPPAKIVLGMITLISYQSPLPGEHLREGVAYLLPPGAPIPFSDLMPTSHAVLQRRAHAVADALQQGGCPAKVDPKTAQLAAFAAAVVVPVVAALETAGWSFTRLRKGPAMELASTAAREAQHTVSAHLNANPPLPLRLARRSEFLGLALRMGARMMPFDLEVYLEYHFTKVGAQTRQILDNYIELGAQNEQSTRSLSILRDLLG